MSKRDWVTLLAEAADAAKRKAGRAEQDGDENGKLWREVAAARAAAAKALQEKAEASAEESAGHRGCRRQ